MAKIHGNIQKYDGSTDESWHTFTCGHCGTVVSAAVVARFSSTNTTWLLCSSCYKGSVEDPRGQYPGIHFGPDVEGLPADIERAYNEARNCMSVNAFTACELVCRKILMHVAVEKGAQERDTFKNYIDYLAEQGYITPPMRGWVELIKDHGNQATHLLEDPVQDRAESTLMFTAELLRLIYEMESMSNRYVKKP